MVTDSISEASPATTSIVPSKDEIVEVSEGTSLPMEEGASSDKIIISGGKLSSSQPSSPANDGSDQDAARLLGEVTDPSSPGGQLSLDEDESRNGQIYYIGHEEERMLEENAEVPWEMVVDSIEQRHKNEMADLTEAHEDEIRSLEGEVRRANTKIGIYQKKIKQLDEARLFNKNYIKEKERIMQHHISTSQVLQRQKDELQQAQFDILTSELENGYQITNVNNLQKVIRDLLHVINGMEQSNQDKQAADRDCLKQNEEMLRDAKKERDGLEAQLKSLQKTLSAMALELLKTQETAQEYWIKMHGLGGEEGRPLDSDDLKKLIGYKDRAYQDLRSEAVECFDRFAELEKSCNKDRISACQEVSSLHDELEGLRSSNEYLKDAKAQYQLRAENYLGFFHRKLVASDLTEAMGDYFDIAIKDNQKLNAKLETQNVEISDLRSKVESLEAKSRQRQDLFKEKEELVADLEAKICQEEIKVHNGEMDLALTANDHQRIINQKDECIAGLQSTAENCKKELSSYIYTNADEGVKAYIIQKEKEAKYYEEYCDKLYAEKSGLEFQLKIKHQADKDNEAHSYYKYCHDNELGMRLEKAYEEIADLKEQIKQPTGFLAAFNQYEEFQDYKARNIALVKDLQAAEEKATKFMALYKENRVNSAEIIPILTGVGKELLRLLKEVDEAGMKDPNFKSELKEAVKECETFFSINAATIEKTGHIDSTFSDNSSDNDEEDDVSTILGISQPPNGSKPFDSSSGGAFSKGKGKARRLPPIPPPHREMAQPNTIDQPETSQAKLTRREDALRMSSRAWARKFDPEGDIF